MTRWSFENKLTFGNVLTMIVTIGGLLVGYVTMAGTVATSADAVKSIPIIENRVTTIETRINIGQQAREAFQTDMKASIESLRVQNSLILQTLSAVVARLDEKDRISK